MIFQIRNFKVKVVSLNFQSDCLVRQLGHWKLFVGPRRGKVCELLNWSPPQIMTLQRIDLLLLCRWGSRSSGCSPCPARRRPCSDPPASLPAEARWDASAAPGSGPCWAARLPSCCRCGSALPWRPWAIPVNRHVTGQTRYLSRYRVWHKQHGSSSCGRLTVSSKSM